ncbi:40S ribosomal protein S8 [Tanacetum coccineum]
MEQPLDHRSVPSQSSCASHGLDNRMLTTLISDPSSSLENRFLFLHLLHQQLESRLSHSNLLWKLTLERQPANTKISSNKTVRRVRVRGGNVKWRALRLDTGNFSWGSEAVTRKTRILD